MDKYFTSIMAALNNKPWVTSELREQAITTVKNYFGSLLDKYEIDTVDYADIEELASDLVDELCLQEYEKEREV